MSEGPEQIEPRKDTDLAGSAEAVDVWRRRLLHTGAAAVPVIVTMQSSVAWALSNCADSRTLPGQTAVRNTITTGRAKALIQSVTGITPAQVDAIAANYIPTDNKIEDIGDNPDAEVLYLLVTNGSCWVSFCNRTSSADGMQAVCNGSD